MAEYQNIFNRVQVRTSPDLGVPVGPSFCGTTESHVHSHSSVRLDR